MSANIVTLFPALWNLSIKELSVIPGQDWSLPGQTVVYLSKRSICVSWQQVDDRPYMRNM